MNDAFERFGAALDDLWQQIRWPIDWILARPWLIVVYALLCLVAVMIDILMR
jgi:hypothetical protein